MTRIELVANDQLLQVTVSPKISSGEVNTVGIHVDFSDEWNNFGKNAVFYTSYNSRDIYEIVMTNDECIVPSEVMKKSGTLYIGIRGVNSEKNDVSVKYNNGAYCIKNNTNYTIEDVSINCDGINYSIDYSIPENSEGEVYSSNKNYTSISCIYTNNNKYKVVKYDNNNNVVDETDWKDIVK